MPRIGAKRGQPPLLPRALRFKKPGGGGARMPERVDAKGADRPHPGFRGIGERAGFLERNPITWNRSPAHSPTRAPNDSVIGVAGWRSGLVQTKRKMP